VVILAFPQSTSNLNPTKRFDPFDFLHLISLTHLISSMKNGSVFYLSFLISFFGLFGLATNVNGAVIVTSVNMVARQQVNLLGVIETLIADGVGNFTFEVDANNNTLAGGCVSEFNSLFRGFLPGGFGGLAGARFDLFSLPGATVTASGNGTHVRNVTNFGMRVFAPDNTVLANFFTSTPSLFESNVISLTDIAGSVFQDALRPNDITQVFVGQNGLGQIEGALVGFSFDRTVTAVPEPSSLVVCILGGLGLFARRRFKK